MGGETIDEGAGKIIFTVHENSVICYEYIFKHEDGLAADHTESGFAHIDALEFVAAVITGLATEDHGNAGCIDGYGTDDGIVF